MKGVGPSNKSDMNWFFGPVEENLKAVVNCERLGAHSQEKKSCWAGNCNGL